MEACASGRRFCRLHWVKGWCGIWWCRFWIQSWQNSSAQRRPFLPLRTVRCFVGSTDAGNNDHKPDQPILIFRMARSATTALTLIRLKKTTCVIPLGSYCRIRIFSPATNGKYPLRKTDATDDEVIVAAKLLQMQTPSSISFRRLQHHADRRRRKLKPGTAPVACDRLPPLPILLSWSSMRQPPPSIPERKRSYRMRDKLMRGHYDFCHRTPSLHCPQQWLYHGLRARGASLNAATMSSWWKNMENTISFILKSGWINIWSAFRNVMLQILGCL